MDDLVLQPTLEGTIMTPGEGDLGSSSLAPFLASLQFEDNTSAPTNPSNQSCSENLLQVNVTLFDYPYRMETWNPITWREVIKIIAYLVIFLVSLTGNLLVILVVFYNAHMRTTTNQYLVNLAISDLLVTLVSMWVYIVRHFSYPNSVLPAVFCKLEGFVHAFSLTASVLTLTAISLGRFVAVMFPFRTIRSPDRPRRVIAALWVTSALLACPMLFYRQTYPIKWRNHTSWQCDEIWPSKVEFDKTRGHCVILYNTKFLFYMVFTIALYFIPVGSMILNYSLIVWRLWVRRVPGEHSIPAHNMATRAKKKVVKMLSVVLGVFVLCWTPMQSLILYSNFVHAQHDSLPSWFHPMEFAAYFIAHSNSALNPIIYCGFNANFRKGFIALLTCRQTSFGRSLHPLPTFRSTLPSESTEAAENWKGTTGATRETTEDSSAPEPVILVEFNSINSRYGQRIDVQLETQAIQNSLSDSGTDSACQRSTHGDALNESQVSSGTAYSQCHHSHSPYRLPGSLRRLPFLAHSRRRREGPQSSSKLARTPAPASEAKDLEGCWCTRKMKDKLRKQKQTSLNERQRFAVSEVRDNVTYNTKEDML